MRTFIMALALAAAAACTQPAPPADTPPETPAASGPQTAAEATAQDTCGASRFQHLIGTQASQIDQSTLPAGARIITPETIVTQDFRPDRLNIFTGTDGSVSSLQCF
jgi:hypothetical protein